MLRLTVENQRNRALTDEVAGLQQMCAQKEADLQQAKAAGEELKRKVRDLEDDCGALQRRCDDTERRYGGLANDGVREGYKKEKEHRLLASQSS